MKHLAAVLFLALTAASLLAAVTNPDYFSVPRRATLAPGQDFYFFNRSVHTLHITSEYTIAVKEGNCGPFVGVDLYIECPPAPVIILDGRPRLLAWAHSNRVHIAPSLF